MTPIAEDYKTRLQALHLELGLGADWLQQCAMPLCVDATDLVDAGHDCFERPQRMDRQTYGAWLAMREAAGQAGVELQLVSAYRSPEYQRDLLQKKIAAGRNLDELMRVNAAPGFSEHHTGRALDLHTPGCQVLTEDFDKTPAFQWLSERAGEFGFVLSYPRNNTVGICYEPWHWCFQPD